VVHAHGFDGATRKMTVTNRESGMTEAETPGWALDGQSSPTFWETVAPHLPQRLLLSVKRTEGFKLAIVFEYVYSVERI
jgi:hypothetical protein